MCVFVGVATLSAAMQRVGKALETRHRCLWKGGLGVGGSNWVTAGTVTGSLYVSVHPACARSSQTVGLERSGKSGCLGRVRFEGCFW